MKNPNMARFGNKNASGGKGVKRHSDEFKKKQSLRHKGSKNIFFKDGKCADKDYRSWQKNLWSTRKKKAVGNHSYQEWEELKKQHKFTCLHCKKKEPEIKLSEDHITPLSRGGSDNIENIQPLCRSCNCKKSNKII